MFTSQLGLGQKSIKKALMGIAATDQQELHNLMFLSINSSTF